MTDTNPGNNTATDTDTPAPKADLAITKTDGVATYTAGTSTTYTIVVTNNGPGASPAPRSSTTCPAAITGDTWTAVASAGASVAAASGSGNISTTVSLIPGATVTFTVVAQISASATGNLVNTATVTAPTGVTDTNLGNNSATDTDTPGVGRISGKVFYDCNTDGSKGSDESGKPNVTVFLDLNNNGTYDSGEPATTTDANGNFAFSGLAAGTYKVRDVVPNGFDQTTANPANIVLGPGGTSSGTLIGLTADSVGHHQLPVPGQRDDELHRPAGQHQRHGHGAGDLHDRAGDHRLPGQPGRLHGPRARPSTRAPPTCRRSTTSPAASSRRGPTR